MALATRPRLLVATLVSSDVAVQCHMASQNCVPAPAPRCCSHGSRKLLLSVASKRLGRKEAGAAYRADRTTHPALLRGTEALGPVLEHGQASLGSNAIDGVEIRHLAKKAHRHDGARPRCDGRLEPAHIDIEILR